MSEFFQFEWDPAKNLSNQRKHGIGFEEAAQLFRDPLFISWKDRVQDGEERWQACGKVEGLSLLLVAHTVCEELEDGSEIEVIRIISARQAKPKERRRYENENG
ncbi:MAG: BrnT family toxin [Terracidiphilus sp.]